MAKTHLKKFYQEQLEGDAYCQNLSLKSGKPFLKLKSTHLCMALRELLTSKNAINCLIGVGCKPKRFIQS